MADAKAPRGNLTFSALNYGTEVLAAQILTGRETKKVGSFEAVTSKQTDAEKKAASWGVMLQALQDNKVVTCSTDQTTVPGIQTRHVFYVAGKTKLLNEDAVFLQDPYGPGHMATKYFLENDTLKETRSAVSSTGLFILRKEDFLNAFSGEDVFILDPQGLNKLPIGQKPPEAGEELPAQNIPTVKPVQSLQLIPKLT